jgi:LmeA-like phospholipid-binding
VPRAGRIVAGSAGALVLLLVLAQVLLPRIAASRISSRVGRYGDVQSVSVSAWPALKLLWREADSVSVRARSLRISPAQTAKLLSEAGGVSSLTVTASSVREGPLQLTAASVRKRASAIVAQGTMSEAAVQAALPAGVRLRLLSSEGGQVRVRASGRTSVLGLLAGGGSLDVVADASGGELIARPLAAPFRTLRLTLFASPHVDVRAVAVRRLPASHGPASYLLTMRARLR